MAGNGVNFNPNIELDPRYKLGTLNGITSQPRVSPATSGNEWGISIPENNYYTFNESGDTMIGAGSDGLNLKHISQSELAYMQKEKGLARNICYAA